MYKLKRRSVPEHARSRRSVPEHTRSFTMAASSIPVFLMQQKASYLHSLLCNVKGINLLSKSNNDKIKAKRYS